MFEVRNTPIIVPEIEVLYELKRQVLEKTGREILYKIKPSSSVGGDIMVCCPNHKEGQERRPSCGITTIAKNGKPAGTVHCFTCGYVDDLPGFVRTCFGSNNPSFGETWLIENFVSGELYQRPDISFLNLRNPIKKKIEYVTEKELASYRFYHPYMYQRKLTNEVIEKYDVGYQSDYKHGDNWTPMEVVTFPVRDKNGNCLFISRRSIQGKHFFLPKMDKPVYGIYELPKDTNEVIVCESVINALTCVTYGKPAVALFGTGTKRQYQELLQLPIRKFILALDPDSAGDKGELKLKHALKGKIVTKLLIPEGKDINDLSLEAFNSLQEIYI